MPSSPSTRLRLELQATGENLNGWGTRLNTALQLVEESVAGVLTLSLTGNVTLSSTNYASDQSRNRVLAFTDGGLLANPTVTIPAVQKLYEVHNRTVIRDIIITAGGASVTVRPGRIDTIYCNGTDCFTDDDPRLNEIRAPNATVSMANFRIVSMGAGTAATDGATLSNTVSQFAAPAAALAMNTQKITGLGLATAATDAASLANKVHDFAAPTAPLAMNTQKITGLGLATNATDAASLANRLDQFAAPTASVSMNSQLLTNVSTPSSGNDAANKAYVDNRRLDQAAAPTSSVSLNGQLITNVATPTTGTDAANRAFVQSEIIAAATISLPPVAGNAGRYLTNNGTVASWGIIDEFAIHALG